MAKEKKSKKQSSDSLSVADFVVDFSKEERGSGFRTKPGTYKVKITGAKPSAAKDKGTPCLELKLTFLEGKLKKKSMTERLWATPKAFSRFRDLLEACGKKVPKAPVLKDIAAEVMGSTLYVLLDDDVDPTGKYATKSRVALRGGFLSEEAATGEGSDSDDELDLDDL